VALSTVPAAWVWREPPAIAAPDLSTYWSSRCTLASTTRSAPSIDPMKEHRSRIGKAVQNNCSPLDGQASPSGLLIGGAAGLENKWGASIAVLLA